MPKPCMLCGEPLEALYADATLTYHRYWRGNIYAERANWDACFHAATGDDARIKRVHIAMGKAEPLLARAYDGDR